MSWGSSMMPAQKSAAACTIASAWGVWSMPSLHTFIGGFEAQGSTAFGPVGSYWTVTVTARAGGGALIRPER
jgi:hypothetical protein